MDDVVKILMEAGVKGIPGTIDKFKRLHDAINGQFLRSSKNQRMYEASLKKSDAAARKHDASFRKLIESNKKMRTTMLGTLFAGYAIKSFFEGLLRPAMEVAGVFDVFGTGLTILFLPIALKILDWALGFLNAVLAMPDAMKSFIGVITLMALAGGAFLIASTVVKRLIVELTGAFTGLTNSATASSTAVDGATSTFSKLKNFGVITIAINTLYEFTTGDVKNGIVGIIEGAGLLLSKTQLGTGLMFTGLTLGIATKIASEDKSSFASKLNDAITGGKLGFAFGSWPGAAIGFLGTFLIETIIDSGKMEQAKRDLDNIKADYNLIMGPKQPTQLPQNIQLNTPSGIKINIPTVSDIQNIVNNNNYNYYNTPSNPNFGLQTSFQSGSTYRG